MHSGAVLRQKQLRNSQTVGTFMANTYRFLDDAQRELTPGCVVQAHALVQGTTSEIETLRSELGRQTSTRLIHQCDEQPLPTSQRSLLRLARPI